MDTTVRREPKSSDRFEAGRRAVSLLCAFLLHALFAVLLIAQVSKIPQDEEERAEPIVIDLSAPAPVDTVLREPERLPEADTTSATHDAPMEQVGDARSEAPIEACTDAPPGQGPVAQTIVEWRRQLQLHFARFKKFPAEALMNRLEGTSLVFVTVCRNGHVQQSRVIRSSGIESLDRASLQLVRRASPLPAVPYSHRGQSIDVVLPVEFSVANLWMRNR